MSPEELRYAKTHEWIGVKTDAQGNKVGTVGISAFAVESLTDLVFIELPKAGARVQAGESFGEVESVKAVSDLYSPVNGEIVEVNSELSENLEWLSEDCYGKGWLIKVRLDDEKPLGDLLDFAAYKQQCAEEQA